MSRLRSYQISSIQMIGRALRVDKYIYIKVKNTSRFNKSPYRRAIRKPCIMIDYPIGQGKTIMKNLAQKR